MSLSLIRITINDFINDPVSGCLERLMRVEGIKLSVINNNMYVNICTVCAKTHTVLSLQYLNKQ